MTGPLRGEELQDERTFLLRSLEDLDREHEAGDLSDEDHAALHDEYVARAAALLRSDVAPAVSVPKEPEEVAAPAVAAAPRPVRRRRGVLVAAGVVVLLGVVVWAVVAHVSNRLPGQTLDGSISLSPAQQTQRTLAQAQSLEGEGDDLDALKLYQSVLKQHPEQQEALAEVGWLEYEAGAAGKDAALLSLGEQQEQKAERVDSGAFAPHLYLGSMLLAQGDAPGAVAEYRLFLADHPPRATVTEAVPFLKKAFAKDHQPLPPLPLAKTAKS
jgi:tetratricopeptide (TPR) repeat protein